MFVKPHVHTKDDGVVRVMFDVSSKGLSNTVFVDMPSGTKPANIGDAALALFLRPAMLQRETLEVDADVSHAMLSNAEKIQRMYCQWDDSLEPVAVHARQKCDHELERRQDNNAIFFTAGADSFYSYYTNQKTVSRLVAVHGFDVPIHHNRLWNTVSTRLSACAEELGVPILYVKTNLRRVITNDVASWDMYHGGALAAIGLLLGNAASAFYISSTFSADVPHGSNAKLDPLWSNDRTSFVHFGADTSRSDKLRSLAKHPTAIRHLRVCYKNHGGKYNCGECEKCMRTMMCLWAAGIEDLKPAFGRNLTLRDFKHFRPVRDASHRRYDTRLCEYYQPIIDMAKARNADPRTISALQRSIMRGKPLLREKIYRAFYNLALAVYHALPNSYKTMICASCGR